MNMEAKKKRGRPPTERGAGNYLPPRILGRVSDEDWALLRSACDASGEALIVWALPLLLREARKRIKAGSK
jgi:hypothetical protein